MVVGVCGDGETHPHGPVVIGEADVDGQFPAGFGDLTHSVEQGVGLVRLEMLGPGGAEQATYRASGAAGPGGVDVNGVSPRVELEYHDRRARQPPTDARVLTGDVMVDDHCAVRH